MAILIPSKNIYDKQNPKVRDNIIERIEVGAIEVVPDNEYETSVYNEKLKYVEQNDTVSQDDIEVDYNIFKGFPTGGEFIYGEAIAYAQITGIYFSGTIKIPKVKDNNFISKIYASVKKENDQTIPEVKYSSNCVKKPANFYAQGTVYGEVVNGISKDDVTINKNSIKRTPIKTTPSKTRLSIPIEAESFAEGSETFEDYDGNTKTITVSKKISIEFKDEKTNLNNLEVREVIIDNIEYYAFDFKILCGAIIDKASSINFMENEGDNPRDIEFNGESEFYTPETVEFTVYGNTIGIDLQDKTVYINGETAKKVHSVDGNELMQTTNYIKETGENAIVKMYGDTQLAYSRGKETATIRCSISDYYDYDDTTKKLIAIDNSTGKMTFKIGDQVIPMVYGADRQDRPMSLYQDGSAKVFQVLGTNIYYDGAVWQELSLQEV